MPFILVTPEHVLCQSQVQTIIKAYLDRKPLPEIHGKRYAVFTASTDNDDLLPLTIVAGGTARFRKYIAMFNEKRVSNGELQLLHSCMILAMKPHHVCCGEMNLMVATGIQAIMNAACGIDQKSTPFSGRYWTTICRTCAPPGSVDTCPPICPTSDEWVNNCIIS